MPFWDLRPRDERARVLGRAVRFTSALDEETERFEQELLAQRIVPCQEHVGKDGVPTSEHGPLDLPLEQRHAWLRHAGLEFRLFQMRDCDGRAAMQAAVYLKRPRFMPIVAHGSVLRFGHATSAAEEQHGLAALRERCAASGDLVTLRLEPRRLGVHALCDLEARARRAGFSLVDPEGITRTLLVDLRASGAELSATLSGKTRKKLRARDSAPFVVRQLLDARHRDACEVAGFASLMRRGKCTSRAPWRVALRILKDDPTRLVAFGLFPRDRPDELVAFAIAERYGQVAEYLSAGALSDAEVRKYPFNYWLLWDIAEWARASGARWLDLGGISDGGPDDLLAGIAAFKHHFSHTETEVGREMMATLRPGFDLAVRAAKLLSRSERSP